MIGVTKAVRDQDVFLLSDDDQDSYIKTVLEACTADLARFTGNARPLSDFVASVTGPHDDPLQGPIHVHTVAAKFDLDALAPETDAYRVHVLEAAGATQGEAPPMPGGVNLL